MKTKAEIQRKLSRMSRLYRVFTTDWCDGFVSALKWMLSEGEIRLSPSEKKRKKAKGRKVC